MLFIWTYCLEAVLLDFIWSCRIIYISILKSNFTIPMYRYSCIHIKSPLTWVVSIRAMELTSCCSKKSTWSLIKALNGEITSAVWLGAPPLQLKQMTYLLKCNLRNLNTFIYSLNITGHIVSNYSWKAKKGRRSWKS